MADAEARVAELPDEAVVVRGGEMGDRDKLKRDAETEYERSGHRGLSVCSLPGLTASQIAETVGQGKLPHTSMRTSTAGRLRRGGFQVFPSGWRGHATLKLPDSPTERDWDNLEAAFDDPVDNPVGRNR